jgi:hypothetical protein
MSDAARTMEDLIWWHREDLLGRDPNGETA